MKNIKKIIVFLIVLILSNFININLVKAEEMCTTEAAQQLAKILYYETGSGNFVGNVENYFFVEATTAGIILNNANGLDGDNWYEKLYNLSDNNYAGYSTYKDKSFDEVVKSNRQGELLYIAELVLTGKYYLPKNLYGQASCACLLGTNHCEGVDTEVPWQNCTGKEGWAQEWIHFESVNPNAFDIYFGYSKYQSLYTTDIFGNKLSSTSPSYYRELAKKYRLTDYSDYTIETVCDGNTLEKNNTTTKPNNKIEFIEACKNPDILKIIYFINIIIDIVKVIVPIALIVLGIMNFSRSVGTNDVEVQKKSVKLLAKRLISAIIIFAIPWLIEVIIVILSDLTGKLNFKECLENANKTKIEMLEKELEEDNENTEGDKPNTAKDYVIYIGDSRTVGMCYDVELKSNENCTIAKSGMGYTWLTSDDVKNKLKEVLSSHPNSYIVINMGTNSGLTTTEGKEYAQFYNELSDTYPNSAVVAVSVTQIDYEKAKKAGLYKNNTLSDDSVSNFNKGLKNNLNQNVTYCDVYSKMEDYNYNTPDGVHYSSETNKFIYTEIQKCLK